MAGLAPSETVRLIRTLDPSDVPRRQQSGNEHPPHLIVGGHGLQSSRVLPSAIHTASGLSGATQYPSSQYDGVKVEEEYMVGRISLFLFDSTQTDCMLFSHRRRNRPIA